MPGQIEKFVKIGEAIVPLSSVRALDIADVEHGIVKVRYGDDMIGTASDFDAFELIMLLKPCAIEGRRLRWAKHAWAFHNLVAHPVMQVLVWCGFKKTGLWLHDITVPKPTGLRTKTA